MDSLELIECLYMSFAEPNGSNRETYRAVFRDWIENIYNTVDGNQEEVINGVSETIQNKIEKQSKYSGKEVVIACIMAGRILQEIIDEQ